MKKLTEQATINSVHLVNPVYFLRESSCDFVEKVLFQ